VNDTETLTIEGTLTALTTIFSGGDEKTGVESSLRRIDYIIDGEKTDVPIIDGNSVRGYLRRLLLTDFFNQIGYEIKTPKLFYLLSGGALEEVELQESGKLNLQLRREIRANLPPLSLLGGSMGNQAFAGKLVVAKALPICKELNDFLPVQSKLSYHEYLTETFATRHAEREPPETVQQNQKKEEPTIQMKINLECFAPGTRFYHKFVLMDLLQIEKSCFARMIELWKQRPFIGGKSAVGYGEIKIDYPKMQWTSKAYIDYLIENKESVRQTLERIEKL
jgi:hypothetical protein